MCLLDLDPVLLQHIGIHVVEDRKWEKGHVLSDSFQAECPKLKI